MGEIILVVFVVVTMLSMIVYLLKTTKDNDTDTE